MSDTSYVPVECLIRHLTQRAALVLELEEGREVWVPFSVIHEDDLADLEVSMEVEINVATWFAEKEGL